MRRVWRFRRHTRAYLKEARELGLAVRNVRAFLFRAVVSKGVHHVSEGKEPLPKKNQKGKQKLTKKKVNMFQVPGGIKKGTD